MKLSSIFEPEPERWGYRGDPWFWRHLKRGFAGTDLPFEPQRLERLIRKEHKRLSGETLREGGTAIVPQFQHGGMSSGGISGTFWVKTGIPLLMQRLEMANAKAKQSEGDKEGEIEA